MTPTLQDKIIKIASTSDIIDYNWQGRGVAPRGYILGMALTYARVYANWKKGDEHALDMAKANTGYDAFDVVSWYDSRFRAYGMINDKDGVNTLRHLWVLLLGLGMRESSGQYWCGRDESAGDETPDETEAGLFQTSYNIISATPLLSRLLADYIAKPDGFLSVFQEGLGVHTSPSYGAGDALHFQKLSKSCPAFAAEFAAVGLRHRRTHWGPVDRRQVQIVPAANNMFKAVQDAVDADNNPAIASSSTFSSGVQFIVLLFGFLLAVINITWALAWPWIIASAVGFTIVAGLLWWWLHSRKR